MTRDESPSAVNPNGGAWTLSQAATEIESQTARWIAAFIGYPIECGGLLVSGGNRANIVCLLAARAARAGWEVRERGVADDRGRRLRAYASSKTQTRVIDSEMRSAVRARVAAA